MTMSHHVRKAIIAGFEKLLVLALPDGRSKRPGGNKGAIRQKKIVRMWWLLIIGRLILLAVPFTRAIEII